jgi:hypothetical protein
MKKTENTSNGTNDISRKEAIKKTGKYAALTTMGTFMILSPKNAQAEYSPPPLGWKKTIIKSSNKLLINKPMKQIFTLLVPVLLTTGTYA